ncbi:MAG: RNA polymerase sigma factor [Victivallis vadensis]
MRYPTTSKTLLDKLQSGDAVSWTEFFDRYRGIIVSLGNLKGLTPEECDDLVQEVMLCFFKNSKTFVFNPQIARFRTYFGRIIQARIFDLLRRRYQSNRLASGMVEPDGSELETPDFLLNEALLCEWRKLLLEDALALLRERVAPETYLAFDLHMRQSLPVEEVMRTLSVNRQFVYTAKTRCLKTLKQIIADWNRQDPELELNTNAL